MTRVVYDVQGISQKKLLGLVSGEIKAQVQVEATTGEIIGEQKPWWARLCCYKGNGPGAKINLLPHYFVF